MARNKRKNNTDNLQARPNKQEQHLWTKKNKHRTGKMCIENSAICRASKDIKTKHKRETCPEGHQNKTKKPFKKQNWKTIQIQKTEFKKNKNEWNTHQWNQIDAEKRLRLCLDLRINLHLSLHIGEGPWPEKYQHINEARFQIIPKASNPTFQNPKGIKPIVKDKLSEQRRKW